MLTERATYMQIYAASVSLSVLQLVPSALGSGGGGESIAYNRGISTTDITEL